MQKQVRLVSMLLCLGMGVAGGLPAYASSESVSVQQQNGICKGVVKDATGEPVIGASVLVKELPMVQLRILMVILLSVE